MSANTSAQNDKIWNHLEAKLYSRRIPVLDGIRAVALFLVILNHFGWTAVPGGHSLMMFFVLSGFLITWLLLEERDRYGNISLSKFYARRAFRILPPFYAYSIVYIALLLAAGREVPWNAAAAAVAYVSNYYSIISGNPNTGFGHTWSLSVEEQFYLLWPPLFLLLTRKGRNPFLYLVLLISAAWIYRFIAAYYLNVSDVYRHTAFEVRLDQLAVGCLLAILIRKKLFAGFWRIVCSNALFPVGTLLLLAISIFCGPLIFSNYLFVIGFAIDPLLIGILLVQAIYFSSSRVFSWLDWRGFQFVGRISYSMYLFQAITVHSIQRNFTELPTIIQLLTSLTLTFAAGTICHYLVERPALWLKDRLFRRTSSGPHSYI